MTVSHCRRQGRCLGRLVSFHALQVLPLRSNETSRDKKCTWPDTGPKPVRPNLKSPSPFSESHRHARSRPPSLPSTLFPSRDGHTSSPHEAPEPEPLSVSLCAEPDGRPLFEPADGCEVRETVQIGQTPLSPCIGLVGSALGDSRPIIRSTAQAQAGLCAARGPSCLAVERKAPVPPSDPPSDRARIQSAAFRRSIRPAWPAAAAAAVEAGPVVEFAPARFG